MSDEKTLTAMQEQEQIIKQMFENASKSLNDEAQKNKTEETKDNSEKTEENTKNGKTIENSDEKENKEGEEGNAGEKDEKKTEEKSEEKKEKEEDTTKKLLVDPEKYGFIPKKFFVLEDGKLNLQKTIEKLAFSYTNVESYASRKNNENEKLKKILEEINSKQKEDDLTEAEMAELYDNPKAFLKKYAEKIKKTQVNTEKPDANEDLLYATNKWCLENDVDEKTRADMGQLFTQLSEQEKATWANLPIESLLEYLKLKVENKRFKEQKGTPYKPQPPLDMKKGVSTPQVSIKKHWHQIKKQL